MGGEAKPLRADARRNRERILDAAEVIVARDGLSASMRTIAQHAGVGLGTIYRNFPTQEALYAEVIIDRTRRLIAEADASLAADDPGAAFFEYLTRIVVDATQKKTLADVLTQAGIDPKAGTADISRDMRNVIERLLVRAQEAGAVRRDLRMPELLALLAAACMAAERDQWSEELRTRTLAVVFDGLRSQR
ncbi:TetR/AcrR family transcriptional regulator [Planotetraspora phitsanulokensis]|uniref:TetR family transcriptional regulator n=1 Tax=Planotetraspora phitsanulokensis TaxID=575192 RepID=A0A8J3XGT6_9ACTN|nr:TetR/AcrR family transcriptional regulator [Planotetraspora phitsanulokensis]GII39336.1 TetR family transcriptional regulator [Planotetraspora phitsanulokensis]